MDDLQYEAQQSYENDCINADKENEFERREDMNADVAREEEVQANYLTDARMGLI